MKILESQNAVLSNFEVFQHLNGIRARYKSGPSKRKMPGNLATLTSEVLQYLRTGPGPLQNQDSKHHYSEEAIRELFERIRAANFSSELTKAEYLSILNMRPSSEPLLGTAIEDMEERFTEEEQAKLLEIIAEVLGSDALAEGEGNEDGDHDAIDSVEG